MPELNVTSKTTLQQLKAFSDKVADGHEIRGKTNKDGSVTLYSKDPKSFSFGMKKDSRSGKAAAAKKAISDILTKTTGGSVGLRSSFTGLFNKNIPSGSTSQVTKGNLSSLLASVDTTLDQVQTHFDQSVYKRQLTQQMQSHLKTLMGQKPTPPAGTTAFANSGADPLRSGGLSTEAKTRIKLGEVQQLKVNEVAHGCKWMMREMGPILPREGMQTLLRGGDILSKAVGTLSYLNIMGNTVVGPEHDLAQPESIQEGATALRDLIDETFSPEQKAAMKERVDFIADLATMMHQKVGLCSSGLSDTDNINAWAKSLTVAGGIEFLGFNPVHDCLDMAVEGASRKDAFGAGRDLMTSLVMHRETIFPED